MSSKQVQFEMRPEDFGRIARPVLIGLSVIAVIVIAYKSIYQVEPSEQAVVMRFGRYHSTQAPGLHFRIPFVDDVLTVDVGERNVRLPFGVDGDHQAANVPEEDVLMLTGDLNAAVVEWTVQWKVSDPQRYLFTFYSGSSREEDQDRFLQYILTVVGRTVMNRLVGDYSIGEVLTSKREEISFKALDATRQMLDKYDCGIRITNLQLQRVLPPSQVRASYAAINEADQTRDKLENESNKEKNTLLPKAKADRDKAIREAEGYAARRRSEVKGEIDALMAQYEQFAKAPQETRQRLYLEALEKVLSQVDDKTIIDSDLQQLLPLLNLNEGSK
ncbi:MAG: FtsH protease activity modulator HflK [Planctomycetaceae bacterium]